MNLGCTIASLARPVRYSDVKPQLLVFLPASTRRTRERGIKSRGRNTKHPTHESHRKLTLMASDSGVSHCDSFAKNAVAFFKKSLSWRSTSTSRLNRRTSLSRSSPDNSDGAMLLVVSSEGCQAPSN